MVPSPGRTPSPLVIKQGAAAAAPIRIFRSRPGQCEWRGRSWKEGVRGRLLPSSKRHSLVLLSACWCPTRTRSSSSRGFLLHKAHPIPQQYIHMYIQPKLQSSQALN